MRSQRLLDALRRRSTALIAKPDELVQYSIANDAGYMLPTFYKTTIELGMLSEAAARPMNTMVATYCTSYSGKDLTKAVLFSIECTRGLPIVEREAALKPFIPAFAGDSLHKFEPSMLLGILKGLFSLHGAENNTPEPLMELKNYLMTYLSSRFVFMQPMEIAELLSIMTRMGKHCVCMSSGVLESFIETIGTAPECAGPLLGSVARFSKNFPLPTNSTVDNFVEFAFDAAMSEKCGAQHQVTILRALVMLESEVPDRFAKADRATKLLAHIRDSGMMNVDGPNLGMMFGILAKLRISDDPIVDTLLESMLPQLPNCKAVTLAAILKNAGHIGIHLPSRLAEAAARRIQAFINNETIDNLLSIMQGASTTASTTPKSRKALMECYTMLLNERGDLMGMEDYARLTRCMARTFGVYRFNPKQREGNDAPQGLLMNEVDLETLENAMMRIATLPREPTWAVVEVVRNLAELGIDYEELKPLARSVFGNPGSIDTRVLTRLIKALQIANCNDPLLIRALADNARRSKNPALMELAKEVIAGIEGRY